MPSTGTLFPSSTSPPVLPVPRQPSPLSFTMLSEDRQPSPPTPASSFLGTGESVSSRSSYPASASSPNLTPTFPNEPLMFSPSVISSSDSPSSSAGPSSRLQSLLLPVEPSPDSLLLRSTFSALEHSTSTLKRLSKSVLNTASVVAALAEQLERAEDDLFNALGDLGRWLENGYGIQSDESVWDGDSGIKKISKQRRRKEREDREIWVENGLKAIKGELKRQGLAGGGAQSKFENTAKQFYHQTSVYLSPQNATASTMSGPSSQTYVPSGTTTASCPASAASHNPSAPSDMAQAFRHAQWDLARYNHHSTLLYAVPPSSIDCLDLLVGLYGWVGGLLDETPGRKDVDEESISGIRRRASTAPINHKVAAIESSQRSSSIYNCEYLKTTLTTSLSHLSRTRNELLKTWAERDRQTQMLEEQIVQRQIDLGINSTAESTWSRLSDGVSSNALTPVSSAGIEHKKGKKMHKIHRSVGGRLMDFLTPSGSSNNLASLSVGSAERLSRVSLDGNFANGATSRPAPVRRRTEGSTTPTSQAVEKLPTHPELPIPSSSSQSNSSAGTTPPLPPKDAGAVRPRLSSRHSVQMPTGNNYVSPFIASDAYSVPPIPYEDSPDLKSLSDKVSSKSRQSLDGGRPSFGGVGGLGAGGDEDERREEAGRKKEGVLWGLGSWEGLNKATGGKGKWEKFWVVLDHSRIYEYRDNKTGVPESAHAVIDLKFASVREVFEIVTPAQGKRLYQATCETEMKLWLYAICNAIESCINGTSSVRTFDASKLRTVSGSLDDHALPARGKLGLGFNSRAIGLGFPVPPNGRRSMPPTPTDNYHSTPESVERRTRKTSLKKVLKQSGERLSNVVSGNSGYRNSFGGGLDLPRPSYLKAGSRTSLPLSTPEMNKFDINHMPPPPIPTSTRPKTNQVEEVATPQKGSWVDGEIEKKVLEMAGLGLGLGDSPVERLENGNGESPNTVKRRVKSEAVRKPTHPSRSGYMNHSEGGGGETMGRSKSNDGTPDEGGQFDMKELKRIADLDGNRKCADCGKGMRSSRWATISIRETPMVLFICIRCCGIHRSLGTHISKPRSVDLDLWTPEMISSAREWGNERGNALWEESWQGGRVSDERITDFIKAKYIEGRWLTNENKLKFKIINEPVAVVGRAI
ncbi:uncharacterized protein I206_101949 [Kwoniella pini CBS 10737]|uniref:Zinc finger protein n=1 Tax=Kwoniella pini CBS 10737 TaxID=1296096 RepID=A0A1B9HV84_9TREE|nr:uncharacterized protein I206_06960 [Kwoniella pini CBS 10737]OCF47182.1 hypothetical protein I206_06960 [Kwoniella pini CBS 10737]